MKPRIHQLITKRSLQINPTILARAIAALLGGLPSAQAVNATWNGTTDSLWGTTTNWSASPVPGGGDTATFNNAGNGNTTITVGTISLTQALFDTASAAAYTLGGGTINFATGTTTAVSMTAAVTTNQTINANLTLGTAVASNTTFNNASAAGLLTFGGNITGGTGGTAAAKTLTFTGAGNTTVLGNIASGTTAGLVLDKRAGAGTLTLSGTNAFASGFNVGGVNATGNGGTVRLASGGSITTSTGVRMLLGLNSGQSGAFTMDAGAGTATFGGNRGSSANYIGVDGGTGTVNANGGTLNFTGMANGSGHVLIGANGGTSNGTMTVAGATVNVGTRIQMGSGYPGDGAAGWVANANGNATLTITSGAINIGTAAAGDTDTDKGFLYLKSPTGGSGTATVNLDGGTLSLAKFMIGAGGTSRVVNFNGGTLRARASRTDFLGTGATLNVKDNGAVIDSNTFDITIAGNLVNGGTGVGGLTKNSAGTLTLTGASTYTGVTTVSGGKLTVSGAGTLAGTTGLAVSGGASFNYLPTTVGTVLTLGAASTLNLNDSSTLGLAWDTTTANKITALGAATIGTGVALNMTGTFAFGTTYTILEAGSGLDTGSYNFVNLTNYSPGVVQTPTSVTITPTAQTALTAAFWKGGLTGFTNVWAVSDGTASNWVTAAGGGATALVPGSGAEVVISATSVTTAPTATVLGASMSIGSLTIADTTHGLGLNADGNTLTIANAAGITMDASVPASSIAASVALGASQTWTNHSINNLTVSGAVSGAHDLTKAGTGTLVLSGGNTYVNTTISAGTLQIGAGGATGTLGSGTVLNDATLIIHRNDAFSVGNVISGSGSVRTSAGSAGQLIDIAADNSYSGGTFIDVGILRLRTDLGGGADLGSGTVTVANGASYEIWAPTAKTLTNNIILNGATGVDNRAALNQDGGAGKVTLTGTVTLNATSDIGIGGGSSNDMEITGEVSGVGGIIVDEKNQSGLNRTLILSGANIYTGPTTVTGGTLKAGVASVANVSGAFGNNSAVTLTNAAGVVLDITGFNTQIGSLTGGGAAGGNVTLGAATLTVGGDNTSPAAYAGVISGTGGGLTKIGSGTLTLTGGNNMTGPVSINAGTLNVSGAGAIGTGAATVSGSGSILNLDRNDTWGAAAFSVQALTIQSGGVVTNGTLTTRGFNAVQSLALDGGELRVTGTARAIADGDLFKFEAYGIRNTVTVTGTTASSITNPSSITNAGINIGGFTDLGGGVGSVLTFDVADVTSSNAADLTVSAVLKNNYGTAGAFAPRVNGLVKTGAGTLELSAINRYTGNTTVSDGTLVLADNAQLRFVLGATSGTTNSLSGAGSAVLSGDFAIDTTAANSLTSGSWTLESVDSLAGPYEESFTVVNPDGSPWTDAGGNLWKKSGVGGRIWTFSELTGDLVLTLNANFASWANDNGVTGGADGDSDFDGIPNLIEYALNLNFAGSDGSAGTFNNNLLSFTKRAVAVTNGDITYAIQESDDLGVGDPWAPVTPTVNDATTISYQLPVGPGPRKFARLLITQVIP